MTLPLSDEQKIKILNSDDIFNVMREVLLREEKIDQEKEHFWMIGLANNNRILYVELVSLGSVNATLVEPMNVYRVAVLKGAVKVVMVHNHPSGEMKPSETDKDLTDRLIQVGRILNIKAIDHLIISTNSYLSFADIGLFEQLEKSIKWVPQYEIIERVKSEEKRIRDEAVKAEKERGEKAVNTEKERGEKEKNKALKAIIKNMLKQGMHLPEIAQYTGLTVEEITLLNMK